MRYVGIVGRGCIYSILGIVIVYILSVVLYLLYTNLNMGHIDIMGHVMSCQYFIEQGMHQFNDQWFMGYITNLFYPPLEDMMCASIHYLTGRSILSSFQLYISIVSAIYILAGVGFASIYTTRGARLLWIFAWISFLLIDKEGLVFMQGLGVMDIVMTGLTSQILGGVFLLGLLYNTYRPSSIYTIICDSLCMIGLVLSHIVLVPFGGALMLSRLLSHAVDWKKYCIAYIGIFLSVVRWLLPFVVYKPYIISSNIFATIPIQVIYLYSVLLVGCLGSAVYIYIQKKHLTLLFVLLPIYIVAIVGALSLVPLFISHTPWADILPPFHYYRFISPAFLLGLSVYIYMIDIGLRLYIPIMRYIYRVIVGSLVLMMTSVIIAFAPVNLYDMMQKPRVQLSQTTILPPALQTKKFFLVDPRRAIGFDMDNTLQLYNTGLGSVKGLFWESSEPNLLITSYIATLLDHRNMVLDYVYRAGMSCDNRNTFFDHFVSDMGLQALIVPLDIDSIPYLTDEKKTCLLSLLQTQKTSAFALTGELQIVIAGEPFAYYQIRDINKKDIYTQDMIIPMTPMTTVRVLPSKKTKRHYFETSINDIVHKPIQTQTVYLHADVGSGIGYDPSLYIIKKPHLPGRSEDVRYPGISQLTSNPIMMWSKSWVMVVGYYISGFSLLIFICIVLYLLANLGASSRNPVNKRSPWS